MKHFILPVRRDCIKKKSPLKLPMQAIIPVVPGLKIPTTESKTRPLIHISSWPSRHICKHIRPAWATKEIPEDSWLRAALRNCYKELIHAAWEGVEHNVRSAASNVWLIVGVMPMGGAGGGGWKLWNIHKANSHHAELVLTVVGFCEIIQYRTAWKRQTTGAAWCFQILVFSRPPKQVLGEKQDAEESSAVSS